MNYYEVVPLKKTGEESRTFTYEHDKPLKIGSMVQIPLKNRLVRGLIIEETKKPKYLTRSIDKSLSVEPILLPHQLDIAKHISEYYLCSLGETINAFLPFDFGKTRREIQASRYKHQDTKRGAIKPKLEQAQIIAKVQKSKPKTTHLVYGVTGSGKTEIYLQLVAEALKRSRGSIILVPEIALTPQTYKRFYERFGDKVAIWHSELKETEKYRTWEQVKSGQKQVVLGARSAIFMPVKDLEYVIIDEEHESSYKQDQNPRYDARLVAEWLTDAVDGKLILGSATPRIESYYRAQKNEYNFYTMDKRIVQAGMPPVSVIDLRDEFRKGNKSIVSDALSEAITDTLKAKKQVMLLLNRRGAATFVVCRDCGYVETCPNCEIPLTYHPSEGQVLKCHHCDYRKATPVVCPECQSPAIRFFGLGTQRAELEVKKLFPSARVVRMDRDTTQKRGSHEEIYHDFSDSKFDILIGTQMIAKGWDLPNVELVGIISADTMINLPDFRSAENTFSLLTQVAGRTGRGFHPGKVVLQTYNPENFAIISAAKHDYVSFYDREIAAREKYAYPPFSSLIKLTYSHPDSTKAGIEAQKMFDILSEYIEKNATAQKAIHLLGPSPSFIEKLAGKYRYQLVLKIPAGKHQITSTKSQSANILEFGIWNLEFTKFLKKNLVKGWEIDIDPESLL
jgi:primosomal protein N' (replication factor Y)